MVAMWADFPKLTDAVRRIWKLNLAMADAEVNDLVKYSRELYATVVLILDRLRVIYKLSITDVSDAKDEDSRVQARYFWAFNQRMYNMAIFTTSYINSLIVIGTHKTHCEEQLKSEI